MYTVQYQYFDENGNQGTKIIEKNSISKLIETMEKHLTNNMLYEITCISTNLYHLDFEQYGEKFIPFNKK